MTLQDLTRLIGRLETAGRVIRDGGYGRLFLEAARALRELAPPEATDPTVNGGKPT